MTSRVETFIKQRADELQFSPEDFEEEEKKVTVRLPLSRVEQLDEVAGKLSMTRTACAEELMRICIDEAYVRVHDHPYFQQRQGIPPATIARIEEDEELRAAIGADPVQHEEVAA